MNREIEGETGQREGAHPVARPRCRHRQEGTVRPGILFPAVFLFALAGWPGEAAGQSLSGGLAAMEEQNQRARDYDYSFLRNAAHVRHLVNLGLLVPLKGNGDYRLDDEVSFAYARPEVRTFIERLGRQYGAACGEQLVVTSLTRPLTHQPRNSSSLSVHPTGMAVDLRRSNRRACRTWIQDVLLHLEGIRTVEATYERRPPHYHVAVYTQEYARYVASLQATERVAAEAEEAIETLAPAGSDGASGTAVVRYQVRSGDTLWAIARAYGTTVDQIKSANNLGSSRIYAGQLLEVPVSSR